MLGRQLKYLQRFQLDASRLLVRPSKWFYWQKLKKIDIPRENGWIENRITTVLHQVDLDGRALVVGQNAV